MQCYRTLLFKKTFCPEVEEDEEEIIFYHPEKNFFKNKVCPVLEIEDEEKIFYPPTRH